MITWVEHEKKFYNLGARSDRSVSLITVIVIVFHVFAISKHYFKYHLCLIDLKYYYP